MDEAGGGELVGEMTEGSGATDGVMAGVDAAGGATMPTAGDGVASGMTDAGDSGARSP